MDRLVEIAAICTKIRVILDKGHFFLDTYIADSALSSSLFAISGLLSGVETLIDPRVTVRNPALGLLFQPINDDNEIQFLTVISLSLLAHAADDALDDVLNHLELGLVFPRIKPKLLTTDILSRFNVLLRLADLHDELKIFDESTCMGPGPFGVSFGISEITSGASWQVYGQREEALKHISGKSLDGEKWNELKDQLLEKGNTGICIVPMSPASAKALYDDTEVKNHFELRVWVNASNSFDGMKAEQKIVDAIYQVVNYHAMAVQNHLPPVYSHKFKLWLETNDMKEFQVEIIKEYQGAIKNEVLGKKFLLVLHAVYEDQMSQFEDIFAPLRHGSSGSRVIITSSSLHVVEALRNTDIQNVNEVRHGLFWKYFCSFAFGGLDPNNYPSLHDSGKKIARYLNRFPLAAKMIGRLLKDNLDETFWRSILDDIIVVNEKGRFENEHHQLLLFIELCFDLLPTPLCWCVRYCSIFPIDWMYTSETLIHLWMSQGFIVSSNTNQRPEDIGKSYFNCLLSRSFFDLSATDGDTSYYVMHRFVHYLADILSLGESLRLEGSYRPRKAWGVRHLSVRTDNLSIMKEIKGFYNLRTFIVFGAFKSETTDSLMPLLKKQHQLLALDLTGCGMSKFPELYSPLKHLRYLNLSDTGVETLHDNFTELTNLQVLHLQGCQLESLPTDTNKLVNLRHIIAPSWLISRISCIGELTNLQELEEFVVGEEKGHEIQQLGGMTQLGGSLSITQLENVLDSGETREAMLSDKDRLVSLKLEWCSSEENYRENSVLDGLQPPLSIKQLEIVGYRGPELPFWLNATYPLQKNIVRNRIGSSMTMPRLIKMALPGFKEKNSSESILKNYLPGSSFENSLSVSNPKNSLSEIIPENSLSVSIPENSLSESIPRYYLLEKIPKNSLSKVKWTKLRVMKLRKLTSVKMVSLDTLTYLNELCFEDMPNWILWFGHEHCFNNLTRLVLKNCPELKRLPDLPYSLQEMHLEEVGLFDLTISRMTLVKVSQLYSIKIIGCRYFHSFKDGFRTLINLKELILVNCPNVSTFVDSNENKYNISLPSGLKHLEITGCDIHDESFFEALLYLDSLSDLKITHCENLRKFPSLDSLKFSRTLERLSIEDCINLRWLNGLETLSSLDELCIIRCPLLRIEYSSIERTRWGLPLLQNLCMGSALVFMVPLVTSLVSLRILKIEEKAGSEELDKLFKEGSFGKCLEQLSLVNCTEVIWLPRNMKELVCLKRLYLERCPLLRSLPELPSRLEELHVMECPLLEETCQEGGSDWYDISYIPDRYFDWE